MRQNIIKVDIKTYTEYNCLRERRTDHDTGLLYFPGAVIGRCGHQAMQASDDVIVDIDAIAVLADRIGKPNFTAAVIF